MTHKLLHGYVKSIVQETLLRELHCVQCGTDGINDPAECPVCAQGEPCERCGQFNPTGTIDNCENCHGMYGL